MIAVSVNVSGGDIAVGLSNDLEEAALMLYNLGTLLDEGEREELADYIANMTRDERATVKALGKLMAEAARD